MKTHTPTFLTPAQDLAKKVFDALYHKEVSDRMSANGAPTNTLEGMDANISGQFADINHAFNRNVAREQNKGAFASEFSHALKAQFAQKGAVKGTWDNMHTQILAMNELEPELHVLMSEAAHPASRVAFIPPVEAAASKVIRIPATDYEGEFAQNMGKAFAAHEEQLKLTQSSALGATPIRNVAQSAVDQQYKAAMESYSTGLEQALDKQLFHDAAMIEMEKTIKASAAHQATLLRPEVHDAVKQHLGEEFSAKLHSIAPAAQAPAFDALHVQDFAAKLKTGLGVHAEQLNLAGASEGVLRGTEEVVAGHYKAAAESFAKGLKGAKNPQAFHDEATAAIEKMIQSHPHTKATLLKPQVHELVETHLGEKLAAMVHTVAHPEIAKEVEANIATPALAQTIEIAAEKASAAIEKAATKAGGKAKWLVGGVGAAVALGAFMHLDGKSHVRNVQNRANNPLNDTALAR